MSDIRKDTKGRPLTNGESQLPDGKYRFHCIGSSGCRMAVYSANPLGRNDLTTFNERYVVQCT